MFLGDLCWQPQGPGGQTIITSVSLQVSRIVTVVPCVGELYKAGGVVDEKHSRQWLYLPVSEWQHLPGYRFTKGLTQNL